MIGIVRTQRPVGQGGFHTGQAISASGNSYTWIFDCSSTRRVQIEDGVTDWCAQHSNVDCLFISHFEADHANGIEKLLKCAAVLDVMLPYVGLYDLAITLIEAALNGRSEDSFVDLVEDPAGYFLNRGAGRVTCRGFGGRGRRGGETGGTVVVTFAAASKSQQARGDRQLSDGRSLRRPPRIHDTYRVTKPGKYLHKVKPIIVKN